MLHITYYSSYTFETPAGTVAGSPARAVG